MKKEKAQAVRKQLIGFFLMISFPVVMMVAEMMELPVNWGLVLVLFIVAPGFALFQLGDDRLKEIKEMEKEERQHERETG